jgi:flagellar hook-length control protein FliK
VTLTPILPVAPAPASATDSEAAGGDGSRFQRTLTEAVGRYRTDGADRSARPRPADAATREPRNQLPDVEESGADASEPAVGDTADAATAAAVAHGADSLLLAQAGVVTVAPVAGLPAVPVPVPAPLPADGRTGATPATTASGHPTEPPGPTATSVGVPAAGTGTSAVDAAPGTVSDVSVATSVAPAADAPSRARSRAQAPADAAATRPGTAERAVPATAPTGPTAAPPPPEGSAPPVVPVVPADAAAVRRGPAPERPSAAPVDALAAPVVAARTGNAPAGDVRPARPAAPAASAGVAVGARTPGTPAFGEVGDAGATTAAATGHRAPANAGAGPDGSAEPASYGPATAAAGGAGPTVSATAPSSAPPAAASAGPAQPVTVPDQVLRHLESVRALRDGGSRTVLRLEPEHLGAVTVTVDVRAGAVRMAVTGAAEALAAVREGIAHLRAALADAGLDLGDVALRPDAPGPSGSASSSGPADSPDGQASPNGPRPDRGADGSSPGDRRPARQHDQGSPAAPDRPDAVRPRQPAAASTGPGPEPLTARRLDVRV